MTHKQILPGPEITVFYRRIELSQLDKKRNSARKLWSRNVQSERDKFCSKTNNLIEAVGNVKVVDSLKMFQLYAVMEEKHATKRTPVYNKSSVINIMQYFSDWRQLAPSVFFGIGFGGNAAGLSWKGLWLCPAFVWKKSPA